MDGKMVSLRAPAILHIISNSGMQNYNNTGEIVSNGKCKRFCNNEHIKYSHKVIPFCVIRITRILKQRMTYYI